MQSSRASHEGRPPAHSPCHKGCLRVDWDADPATMGRAGRRRVSPLSHLRAAGQVLLVQSGRCAALPMVMLPERVALGMHSIVQSQPTHGLVQLPRGLPMTAFMLMFSLGAGTIAGDTIK